MRYPLFLGAVVFVAVAILVGLWLGTPRAASPVFSSTPTPHISESTDPFLILDTPTAESVIRSPLTVRGRARGTWFFEGSFPVVLTDWDGRIIAQVPAQAQGEWMTEDFVPFEATITFTNPAAVVSSRGALILKKDNPSGDPARDDAREITVFFAQ